MSLSDIEQRASDATDLSPFTINLHHVRESVRDILNEWKSSGVFYEYTNHSFDHVEGMIDLASWIIPKPTQQVMTKGDWLTLVLAIYMHDLGLLVTKSEFEARESNPAYLAFVENPLLPAEKHREYEARLKELGPVEAARLNYQEFVRATHGKRIRAWIEGGALDDGGATAAVRAAVVDLLKPLEKTFRADLALVAESHTLDHQSAISGLPVSKPYGSAEATVNLQYIAIILRTADLLQITAGRAPTVLFQLINPSNPTSQLEWHKQNSVRSVRPALPRDRDGAVTTTGLSSIVEIHATFEEPSGFFGLTDYLAYAQREIAASYNIVQLSARDLDKPYLFPWRDIDTSGIDTKGFLTESFEFTLDQHKILDLLTGHTLYNNSAVVLRELTQNGLDAIRLQADIEKKNSSNSGHLQIFWNSESRSLTIMDNGTGMSQDVIERHLLTVGSSRYQDPKFKEKYPRFHSISRFGIGVLSAFMVSDDVEIVTCTTDQEDARKIALQSVHGKYLIKLINKNTERDQLAMYPHGTSVRLKLRPTAKMGDILRLAQSWLVFPRCKVTVYVDNEEPVSVGYENPAAAIKSHMESRRGVHSSNYEIKEREANGVQLAFAVSKGRLFDDYTFVMSTSERRAPDAPPPLIATCIEGVAVEHHSPGFMGLSITAVANATGRSAPKTNVARSALEDTTEQRAMLATVYQLYAQHVTDELARLPQSDDYSLSRAVSLAPFIAGPLINPVAQPVKSELLLDALAGIPLFLVENEKGRQSISFTQLKSLDRFRIVDSALYRSMEYFVREATGDVSAQSILKSLGRRLDVEGSDVVLCNFNSNYVHDMVKETFEPKTIDVSSRNRALIMTWEKRAEPQRWWSSTEIYNRLRKYDSEAAQRVIDARERNSAGQRRDFSTLNFSTDDIKVTGLEEYGACISNFELYLKPGTALAEFLASCAKEGEDGLPNLASGLAVIEGARGAGIPWSSFSNESLDRLLAGALENVKPFLIDRERLVKAVSQTPSAIFDSYAWDKRGGGSIWGGPHG